jgi:hypothetical protein
MNNNSTYITSVESKLIIPDVLTKKMATDKNKVKLPKFIIPSVLETIEHKSSESFVCGNIELVYLSDDMQVGFKKVPVFARFLFTGKKHKEEQFNLDWCTSLS